MRKPSQNARPEEKPADDGAFTLVEVVISIMITGVVFAGILTGYITSARRAEWSGYMLAAEGLNMQQMEQIRAAKWDTQTTGTNWDETTNMNLIGWSQSGGVWKGYTFTNLDTPFNSTNASTIIMATNYMTMFTLTLSTNPYTSVKMIKADTVWPYRGKFYTNSIATYRAPDQ